MRQVVTRRTFGVRGLPKRERSGEQEGYDTYRERMLKYVPVETVVAWIGVFGPMSAVRIQRGVLSPLCAMGADPRHDRDMDVS